MDSSGQMGAPFTEGKRGVRLWSRVEADPPLAASIPAASNPAESYRQMEQPVSTGIDSPRLFVL
ncbi:MAG TPA: hypothetical protein VF664_17210, partial [Cystobacter sp.]